jgi:hypothetical protein
MSSLDYVIYTTIPEGEQKVQFGHLALYHIGEICQELGESRHKELMGRIGHKGRGDSRLPNHPISYT